MRQIDESLIAVGRNGGRFAEWAAHRLLSECECHGGARFWILVANLNIGDGDTVRELLQDWSGLGAERSAPVGKFTPGTHYYALGVKFDTLGEAIDHLRSHGYAYSGLVEEYVYRPE